MYEKPDEGPQLGAAGQNGTTMTGTAGVTERSDTARVVSPIPTQRRGSGIEVVDLVTGAAAAFTDFRDGVADGMERLVRLVTPLLWHTARQCGLSPAEAEDSVQQTFLTLVRKGDSISDPLAVVRWLTVTLRRQAWRDRATGNLRAGGEPTDEVLPPEPSAEAKAVLSDEQRRLWDHVSALSERCRRLLAVIAFAPRPDYVSVARDLGMPIGSIGPTRGRCLEKLRHRLEGEDWS